MRLLSALFVGGLIALGTATLGAVPSVGAEADRDLLLITDSVMLAMHPSLGGDVEDIPADLGGEWDLTFDGRLGSWTVDGGALNRPTSAVPGLLQDYSEESGDVVVIGTGYNDSSAAQYVGLMEGILASLASSDLVVLATLSETGSRSDEYAAINRYIRDAASTRPNVVVAEWAPIVGADPALTWSDGIHLTPAGATRMAQLLTEVLSTALAGICEEPVTQTAAANPSTAEGYWVLSGGGSVTTVGGAEHLGDIADSGQRAVALAATPDREGYWILDDGGAVHPFGTATHHGDLVSLVLTPNQPALDIVATVGGGGYWLVAGDGGVFAFGDAPFMGSMGGHRLNRPVIAMAVDPGGAGYWLYASDGGVFTFGAYLEFHGSIPGRSFACGAPTAVAMQVTPSGDGYWVAASDGRIVTFGDAFHHGHGADPGTADRVVDLAIS